MEIRGRISNIWYAARLYRWMTVEIPEILMEVMDSWKWCIRGYEHTCKKMKEVIYRIKGSQQRSNIWRSNESRRHATWPVFLVLVRKWTMVHKRRSKRGRKHQKYMQTCESYKVTEERGQSAESEECNGKNLVRILSFCQCFAVDEMKKDL